MIIIKAGTLSRELDLHQVALRRHDEARAAILKQIAEREESGIPLDGLVDPGEYPGTDHGLKGSCKTVSRADLLNFRMQLGQADGIKEQTEIIAAAFKQADLKITGLKSHDGTDLESTPELIADQLVGEGLMIFNEVQELGSDWPKRCG